MTDYLALLDAGIECWNQWRASHPNEVCTLEGQDLSHGYFFEGNFRNVNLRGANLQRACLVGADFSGADLSNADLTGAYLGDANLHGADLHNTDLSKANLERADMRHTHLAGTRLADADIRTAKLPDPEQDVYADSVLYWLSKKEAMGQPDKPLASAKAASNRNRQLATRSLVGPRRLFSRGTKETKAQRQQNIRLSGFAPSSKSAAGLTRSVKQFKSATPASGSASNAAQPSQSQKKKVLSSQHPSFKQPWGRRQADKRLLPKLKRWGQQNTWVVTAAAAAISLAIGIPPITALTTNAQPEMAAQSGTSLALAKSLTGASQVWSVATHTSEEGTSWVIGGGDQGQIEIWDGATGDTLRTIDAHTTGIKTLAVSSSGQWLVSGSRDGLKVWNPQTGELIHSLDAAASTIETVAISPDERSFLSSNQDGTITAWDLRTGDARYSIENDAKVWSIAIAPDGKTFVSGRGDRTIQQRDLASGALIQDFSGHGAAVRSVAISPDGTTLASGSTDETIRLWDMATGRLQTTLEGHSDRILSLAISPDGKTLASSSTDETIRLWDLPSRQLTTTLDESADTLVAIAFDPTNQTLVSGGQNQTIQIWQ
ncbi:MAG: pentapeptide repeat-containing protein [Cyanobacteria bacterium J06554_3]